MKPINLGEKPAVCVLLDDPRDCCRVLLIQRSNAARIVLLWLDRN
jgi:8-oxo-dGTP pyrophosphatase MutT (NUDIX family)